MICDAWIEFMDRELRCEVEFEPDEPERIIGCWVKGGDEHDLLDNLTDEQVRQAAGWAISHVEALAEQKEAERHDYGDWLYQKRKDDRLTGDA